MVLLRKKNEYEEIGFADKELFCWRFQTPAARFQEPRRDVRSANNNNIKGKKGPASGPENKQKQHDNKRVNNQPNSGVSANLSFPLRDNIFLRYFQEKKYQPIGAEKDLVEGLERDIVQKDPNVRW